MRPSRFTITIASGNASRSPRNFASSTAGLPQNLEPGDVLLADDDGPIARALSGRLDGNIDVHRRPIASYAPGLVALRALRRRGANESLLFLAQVRGYDQVDERLADRIFAREIQTGDRTAVPENDHAFGRDRGKRVGDMVDDELGVNRGKSCGHRRPSRLGDARRASGPGGACASVRSVNLVYDARHVNANSRDTVPRQRKCDS